MTTQGLLAAFESLLSEPRILEDIQKALSRIRQGDVYVIGFDDHVLQAPCDAPLSVISKIIRVEYYEGMPYVLYIVLTGLGGVRFKPFIESQYSLFELTYDRDLKILDIDAYKDILSDDQNTHLLPAD